MAEERTPIERRIQEELDIDETKLDEELLRQPSRFFYWASAWCLAGREAKKSKIRTDEIEAKLCREYKEKMAKEDSKLRVTEKMLNDYVAEHPEFKASKEIQAQEEYKVDVLGVAKDAFRQRSQALIELFKTTKDQGYLEREGFKAMQEELEERRSRKGE
jgi:hypothetical protein